MDPSIKKPVIELKNISKKYGNKVIFEGFDLSIFKQDMLCIMGVSGSGKSTLLYIMGLLETIDSGKIYYYGNEIRYTDKVVNTILREKVGFLFQNHGLVDDRSVDYNLDLVKENSKTEHWDKEKSDVIKMLGLDNSIKKEKCYKLSGGEQQRVAMARLILKDSAIILADEPTGSLDEKNRDVILETLDILNKRGRTIIIVTHDRIVASACSRRINI